MGTGLRSLLPPFLLRFKQLSCKWHRRAGLIRCVLTLWIIGCAYACNVHHCRTALRVGVYS
jgi:hypothetical protein